ncbi:MAG: hypothetical protein AB1597_06125 [Chloroflexota bacterium]
MAKALLLMTLEESWLGVKLALAAAVIPEVAQTEKTCRRRV